MDITETSTNILIVLILILLIFIIFLFISYRASTQILKWFNAKKIEKSERSLLYSILEDLSRKAGIETPELLSFESEIPEMFTVGSRKKPSIAVSISMLELFDEMDLESLLGHEVGHIKNNDVSLNTITAFLAGSIMSFPDFVMWCSLLTGFGQPEDPAPKFFKFMATAIAAPPAATLILLTNPAKRELAADEISIKLTGKPQTLVKTIEYLENYISLQPVTARFNPGHFHLFSTHTQQIRGYLSIFISMFDTHPGIEYRISHIMKFSSNPELKIVSSKYSRVPGFFDLKSWKLAMATSFVSYFSFLFVLIVIITFAMKDFNFLVSGIIMGVYIVAVLLLIGTTAKLSRKNHNLK